MPIAADYPFLDVFWTMCIFFLWVLWFWLLFTVFADIFRRRDLSGWGKAGWIVFTIILPYLGVFIYLITQGRNMTERNIERARPTGRSSTSTSARPRPPAAPAAEIDKAKQLLDSGAITQPEFEALKQKALAA